MKVRRFDGESGKKKSIGFGDEVGRGRIDVEECFVSEARSIGGFAANSVGRKYVVAGDGGYASGKGDSAEKAGGKLG